MIKWLSFLGLLCLAFILTGCAHFKGRETITNEKLTIKDLPDKIEGVDLVEIITATGHIVEVSRKSIPKDETGNPYWPVVKVDKNETLEGAADTASSIPGPGTMVAGVLTIASLFLARNQQKQKQAEIDAGIKKEEKIKRRDKLLIAVGVGVEIATIDGEIKEAINALMTKSQQAEFDEITEVDRKKIEVAKLSEKAT